MQDTRDQAARYPLPAVKLDSRVMVKKLEPRSAVSKRCSACQLQICKSRDEQPHAALKIADNGVGMTPGDARHTAYLCQTCAAILVRSTDLMEAGWRQRR